MVSKEVKPEDFHRVANSATFILRRFNPNPEPFEIGRDFRKRVIYTTKDWKAWLEYVDNRRYDANDLWSYQR